MFAVIPFGPSITLNGSIVAMAEATEFDCSGHCANRRDDSARRQGDQFAITDINIGVLYVVAISSVSILGIILGGWASNSKYPLMGALRSAAQMVSYEVALGFSIMGVSDDVVDAEPGADC